MPNRANKKFITWAIISAAIVSAGIVALSPSVSALLRTPAGTERQSLDTLGTQKPSAPVMFVGDTTSFRRAWPPTQMPDGKYISSVNGVGNREYILMLDCHPKTGPQQGICPVHVAECHTPRTGCSFVTKYEKIASGCCPKLCYSENAKRVQCTPTTRATITTTSAIATSATTGITSAKSTRKSTTTKGIRRRLGMSELG